MNMTPKFDANYYAQMTYQTTNNPTDWTSFWEDDSRCVEERLTADEYDEHLERRLYERSNRL